jgi:hypothetical protein
MPWSSMRSTWLASARRPTLASTVASEPSSWLSRARTAWAVPRPPYWSTPRERTAWHSGLCARAHASVLRISKCTALDCSCLRGDPSVHSDSRSVTPVRCQDVMQYASKTNATGCSVVANRDINGLCVPRVVGPHAVGPTGRGVRRARRGAGSRHAGIPASYGFVKQTLKCPPSGSSCGASLVSPCRSRCRSSG